MHLIKALASKPFDFCNISMHCKRYEEPIRIAGTLLSFDSCEEKEEDDEDSIDELEDSEISENIANSILGPIETF